MTTAAATGYHLSTYSMAALQQPSEAEERKLRRRSVAEVFGSRLTDADDKKTRQSRAFPKVHLLSSP